MNPCSRPLAVLVASILLTSFAPAAKKDDPLERMTPVPEDTPIPALDFFRPPLLGSPRINEAGTRVAAFAAFPGDHTGLLFVDLDTMKTRTLRGSLDKDVYRFSWLTDDRVLFSVSEDKLYTTGMYVADAVNPRKNYMIEQYSVVHVIGRPLASPTRPIVWVKHNAYDESKDAGALQIDATIDMHRDATLAPGMKGTRDDSPLGTYGVAASVKRSFPKPPEGSTLAYLPEIDGELGYVLTIDADQKLKLFALVDGRWKPCALDLEELEIEDISDRPGELLVLSPGKSGEPRGLYRANALTGELGELLLRDPDVDCDGIAVHRDITTRRILGLTYMGRVEKTVWFDPERQRIQELVQKSFPGQIVTLIDADKANDRFLIETYSDRHPTAYQTLHFSKLSMALMKNTRPWIDPKRMRPMQPIAYKTRDGVQIEGYLTLPEGASKEHPVPMVVNPHGGPWARDSWGWNPEVQFLASRGYAVFQPNYRGSTGYDWKFSRADLDDFQKMHQDVTDGVMRILKLGVIDSDRIAIMGGSFGGYLALCGAAFEENLYRCAITMSGVFDWELLMRAARRDQTRTARYRFWLRRVGDPKDDAERFAEISPLRHVEQVRIPIFVQHGREDSVVEVAQSKRLVAELEKHGVPFVVRIDRNEGHGNIRLENRVELYTEIEAFLAEHLTPRPAAVAASGDR